LPLSGFGAAVHAARSPESGTPGAPNRGRSAWAEGSLRGNRRSRGPPPEGASKMSGRGRRASVARANEPLQPRRHGRERAPPNPETTHDGSPRKKLGGVVVVVGPALVDRRGSDPPRVGLPPGEAMAVVRSLGVHGSPRTVGRCWRRSRLGRVDIVVSGIASKGTGKGLHGPRANDVTRNGSGLGIARAAAAGLSTCSRYSAGTRSAARRAT